MPETVGRAREASLDERSPSKSASTSIPATEMAKSDIEKKQTLRLTDSEAINHIRAHSEDDTPILLHFSPDDADNPRNWSRSKKWMVTCLVAWLNFLL